MGLHYHYSHPTTPAGTGFDIDLGDVVQQGALSDLVTSAVAADVGMSNVTIDDPTGSLDIKSLHRFYVVEDESPAGDTVVWNGYINDQKISRTTYGETYLHGAARGWDISLADDNAIFGFRVVWDTDGERPAESSSARLTWLLGTANAYLPVYDEGLVDWASMSTANMDACDYRGQFAGQVIEDIALHQDPPWNWWAQYEETSEHIQLWLADSNTSTAFTSTIAISNLEADCDYETTFPPGMDAALTRDSTKIAAGVYLPYSGTATSAVYVYDYDTSYAYGFRDQVAPSANVKTVTSATSRANAFLAEHDEPDEKVSCRIWLPADKVTALKAGMRLQAKFSHFPDYEDWRWMRVTQRTVGQFERTLGVYEVGLELSPMVIAAPLSCTSAVSTHEEASSKGMYWTFDTSIDITPTLDPSLLIAVLAQSDAATVSDVDDYTTIEKPYSSVVIACRQVGTPSGTYTAAATFTEENPGQGDGSHISTQIALRTSASVPVQSVMIDGQDAVDLADPPTPGNILLMFGFGACQGGYLEVDKEIWTELFYDDTYDVWLGSTGDARYILSVGIWAHCVEEGDGVHYGFVKHGGYVGANSCAVAEFEIIA